MYNDLFDFRPSNKEMAALILVVLIVLVVCFGAGYLLGVERTQDLYDHGSGAAGVGQQIGEAGAAVGDAAAGVSAAAGTADKIGAGLADAKGTAQYIHSTAQTSAELIGECQSIIRSIRARGQKGTTAY